MNDKIAAAKAKYIAEVVEEAEAKAWEEIVAEDEERGEEDAQPRLLS